MAKGKITPRTNRAKPPAFHELPDDTFEEMCCAILETDSRISKTDLYKTKRQKQYGVDVVGELEDGEGLYVISCKVRARLTKGDIPAFGKEFLDHWNHWKDKKVKKFILAVTQNTNSDQRQKEIEEQRKKFKSLGIQYEDWPPRTLTAKIRPHRGIASQYLGDIIAEQICGRDQPDSAPSQNNQALIDAAITQQLAAVQKALSGKIEGQLEAAREKIRRKEGSQVDSILAEIENDNAQWSSLPNETKAAVKRLQASRALHTNNLVLAKELCDAAAKFHGEKLLNLKALIALVEKGSSESLKILKDAHTSEELKFRAGLYLNVLDIKSALSDLDKLSDEEKDGEVLRLYSVAYMMDSDRSKALAFLHQAEKEYGSWYAVKKTGIMIRFHLAYSSSVPFQVSAWPNPIIPELVREDEQAREWLEEGLRGTEELLEKAKDDPDETKDLQVWYLAFLSNLKQRSLEAESYVQNLLTADKTHAGVIIWSLARGYNFDAEASKLALESLVSRGKADIEQILCLTGIYLDKDEKDKASVLLKASEERFNNPDLKETWRHWNKKVHDGYAEDPGEQADIDDRLAYFTHLSIKTGCWDNLISFIKTADKEQLKPEHIFLASLNLARAGQWDLIKPYIPVLIDKIKTPDAVQVAAWSAFKTEDMALTIEILDQNIAVFSDHKLPIGLRRVRKRAALSEGDVPYALSEGEKLAIETTATEDRMDQIQALVSIGDVKGALPHIRSIAGGDLSATVALQLSTVIQSEDPTLARQLFKKISFSDLPDEYIGPVVGQAHRLGISSEVRELFGRMNQIADTDSQFIRTFSLEEVQQFIQDQHKQQQKTDKMYVQGAIPIHLVSGEFLSGLIAGNFIDNSEFSLAKKSKLLCRFGGRRPNLDVNLDTTDLHLDITSVLIAHHLGILDLIENAVASINIAPSLPLALIEAKDDLAHPQPDRIETMREVTGAVKDKKINTLQNTDDLDKFIDQENVFVVEHDSDLSTADRTPTNFSINIRQLVDSLMYYGAVDSSKIQDLEVALPGYMAAQAYGRRPERSDKIAFRFNTFELLVAQGLLDQCTKIFDVYIDPAYLKHAEEEITMAQRKEDIARSVSELRDNVSNKIKSGNYKTFPSSSMETIQKESERISNHTETCLYELVRLKNGENRLVVVDDRLVNRHTNINENLIIDIYDVLSSLRSAGMINSAEFYGYLISLRKANYYYLPFDAEEILYQLKKAGPDIDQDNETEALKIIRQYYSMLALQEGFLQINAQDPNAVDEKSVLLTTFLLPDKTILSVWSDPELSLEQKKKYSTWIWSSLRVERMTGVPIRQPTEEGHQHLYTVLLAGMLANILQIPHEEGSGYLEWVNQCVFEDAISANGWLPKKIEKYLADILLGFLTDPDGNPHTEQDKIRLGMYISDFVKDFPDLIEEKLLENRELSAFINLKRITSIGLGGKQYLASEFWRGVAQVLEGGSASVKTTDKKDNVELFLHESESSFPVLRIGKNGKDIISDPIFSFFYKDEKEIDRAFEMNAEWFEYPAPQKRKILNKIKRTKDIVKRARIIEDERSSAPAYKYGQIEARIEKENSFDWVAILPLPAERIANHLRLRVSKSKDLSVRLKRAAEEILKEGDATLAFRYFSGLPVDMPESVLNAFKALDKRDLDEMLQSAYHLCRTPLRLFNFLYLVRAVKDNPGKFKEFNQATETLKNIGLNLCEAYSAMLHFFDKVFYNDTEWQKLPAEERAIISWYHTDQIANLLIGYGMPVDDIINNFKSRASSKSNHFMLRDADYRSCAFSPSNARAKKIFFYGLNLAFGDDGIDDSKNKDEFKKYFVIEEDGKSLSDPAILQDSIRPSHSLKSFLAKDAGVFSSSFGDENFSKWVQPESRKELIQELSDSIKADPDQINIWLYLSLCCHPGMLLFHSETIMGEVSNIDFYTLFKKEGETTAAALRYISEAISLSGDPELVENLKKSILKTTEKLALENKRPIYLSDQSAYDWVSHAAVSLCDAMVTLSRRDTLGAAIEALAENTLVMSMVWPSLAPIWRKAINSMAEDVDFTIAKPLWDTILKLRTME